MNVLVFAFREDTPDHARFRDWLNDVIQRDEPFAVSDHVLSRFLRVVTLRRVFPIPTPLERALDFVSALREQPTCVQISPGPRHWDLFIRLCRAADVTGNLVPDAYLAALAIESGSELVTTDRDFSRFPDLRWRHPLEAAS